MADYPQGATRVWITDGSLPVFDDTLRLSASHPVLAGLKTRYEGFVDPAVPRGSLEVRAERPDDALCVEVEWYVEFPDGAPERPSAETPVLLQGFLEGKWMNRLLGTRAWRPASLGNNVIGAGPGLATTLGALEQGVDAVARVEYRSVGAGEREHVTSGHDLVGHAVPALVADVLASGAVVDGIDLGALGGASAVVNEKPRVLRAALPWPAPHRAKERLVRRALADGVAIAPGSAATLQVTAGGEVVGKATLTLAG